MYIWLIERRSRVPSSPHGTSQGRFCRLGQRARLLRPLSTADPKLHRIIQPPVSLSTIYTFIDSLSLLSLALSIYLSLAYYIYLYIFPKPLILLETCSINISLPLITLSPYISIYIYFINTHTHTISLRLSVSLLYISIFSIYLLFISLLSISIIIHLLFFVSIFSLSHKQTYTHYISTLSPIYVIRGDLPHRQIGDKSLTSNNIDAKNIHLSTLFPPFRTLFLCLLVYI